MIVITGGTGFVGRAIAERLLLNGNQVRLISRNAPRFPSNSILQKAEWAKGDVTDLGSLQDCFKGAQAMIHLVGIIVETRRQKFQQAHVDATRNALYAAEQNGVKRFIHMSALGSRPHAASRYHQTKWEAEELVRASRLDWTIFRPAVIFGKGDGFVNQFAAMMRFPRNLFQFFCVPCFGNGNTPFQPIAVEDVAFCFSRALTSEKTIGKTFELCATDVIVLRDLLMAIAKAQGLHPTFIASSFELLPFVIPWKWLTASKPLIVTIPFKVAYGLAFLLEKIFSCPPLTRDQVVMLEEGNRYDPNPAMEVFHVIPRSFYTGIDDYLRPQ